MRKITRPARRATATKVIASVALLAGAASVAGLGTFGAFTDTTTANQAVATGTVEFVDLKAQLSADVEGMVPGDWIERPVTLIRDKDSETFESLKLTTTAVGEAGLTAAATGLQLTVDECSVPWTEDGKAWTCTGGTTTPVIAETDVVGQNRALTDSVTRVNAEGEAYLRVKLALPNTVADQNALKNKNATVTFTFDATQRAGEAR
ncbi:hypothetical protein GHK92_18185 [Nocardioides sp. dk4132]|uniref:TasA family protein n=1 Tax=unclassified Nocardioides TaxID=2615069 RepID=UPI00129781E1|nr:MULTISPECIES: TasA family protein [unclassified Nocardioides]MQW77804.1 hypothetical protein [Nocardioides sp. dk4132]QGA08198.1 hypothetical protein GFH29_12890 [Nocardioides sp. dk884]